MCVLLCNSEVTSAMLSTAATSAAVGVECRQLTDGDCVDVTCGDDGYATDENGCDICTCAVATTEKQPTKTVHRVVADARKGMISHVYTCIA